MKTESMKNSYRDLKLVTGALWVIVSLLVGYGIFIDHHDVQGYFLLAIFVPAAAMFSLLTLSVKRGLKELEDKDLG